MHQDIGLHTTTMLQITCMFIIRLSFCNIQGTKKWESEKRLLMDSNCISSSDQSEHNGWDKNLE
eukprot:6296448-Ditylum_brightwellii.AAC.1